MSVRDEEQDESEALQLEPAALKRVLSTWVIDVEDAPQVIVRYGVDERGRYGYALEQASEQVAEFLSFYLTDPLNSGRVYLHGLGPQKGPYTRNQEVFDEAMW